MAALPRIAAADVHRVRRFDAVVLGAALPGLVAAIRLAQRGARVLVVEEEAAARAHPAWREPFLLWDAEPRGVLGSCLRALALPLIDQRRLLAEDRALQIASPRTRIDWGRAGLAASELTSWGLAKPDESRALLRGLAAAAREARDAWLASIAPERPRKGRDAPAAREPSADARAQDPLVALRTASPGLRALLEGLARALSDHGGAELCALARLRLLGGILAGGAVLAGEAGLRDLLWRRLASLFGERRTIQGHLRLVGTSHLAAVEAPGIQEIYAGRALVLNAPRESLALAHEAAPPALLRCAPAPWRRVTLELHAPAELLPDAMAERLIALGAGEPLRVARCGGRRAGERAELLVSTVAPRDADIPAIHARLEGAVRDLAPFCAARLETRPHPAPRWDRDDLLHDVAASAQEPAPTCLRLSSRPLVVSLERAASGAFSFEGDLLLGWRAGDDLVALLG
jgi:hypothetical protein